MTEPPIVPRWQHRPDDALTVFTIYARHSECSGDYFVVIPWTVSASGQIQHEPLGAVPTVMDARKLIPPWADFALARTPNDAPDVVETWI